MSEQTNIWQYLQGELNGAERQAFRKWLDASESNRQEFETTKEIWEECQYLPSYFLVDTEESWLELSPKLKDSQSKQKRLIRLTGIAASFLLVASLFIWYYLIKEDPLYQELYTKHEAFDLVLPDSSMISLDKNSYIRYFTRIEEVMTDRRIYVNGKATFRIKADTLMPFIVEVAETGIKVLGTSFIVDQRGSAEISVENLEGLIKFYELSNEENAVIINPGEVFRYDGSGFQDLSKKEEPEPHIEPGQDLNIETILERLFLKFDGRFNTGPYGKFDLKTVIQIDLDQSLENIIMDLDRKTKMEYRKTCSNCYEVRSIQVKE